MKKLGIKVALLFSLVSLLFTSCDFLADLGKEFAKALTCPTISVYLYPNGSYKSDTATLTVPNEFEVCYEIEYSSSSNTDDVEFILKSTDESIAVPLESSFSTSKTEGSFYIKGVNEGNCEIKMFVKDFEDNFAGCDIIYVKVTPEKTVHIVDADGNPLSSVTMYKDGDKYLYSKNTFDKNAVKWSSTNTSVVTVSNGHIVAKKAGEAVIKLESKYGEVSDTCKVIVHDASGWTISINSSVPDKILPGDSFKLNCDVSVADGVSKEVHWESSDRSIARIDDSGKVTAVSPGNVNFYAVLVENSSVKSSSFPVTVAAPPVTCNQFFWGKWQRMDTGEVYEVQETCVIYNGKEYDIVESSATNLTTKPIGDFEKFVKDADGIIKGFDKKKEISIPFYRQGGTNLKYKVRVVGFADEIGGRAASTESTLVGKKAKIKTQSEKYSSFNREKETDDDGFVVLEVPVQGDTQTLTVIDEITNEVVVVPGLKIENDGANMGTIPLVGKEDYSLKVTGTIDESKTDNGYLYGNNYKTYPMTLTITNISEIMSASSSCKIYTDDPNLSIELVNSMYDIDDIGISSMKSGATKTLKLNVKYGTLINDYKETEIKIEITNMNTMRTWVDYVPLKFFAGQMPITIAARSTEGNEDATLNGFLIYPDGNSMFFKFKNGPDAYRTLHIPIFGNGNNTLYKMVFCGASVTGNLEESGELFYTVNFNSTSPIKLTKENMKMSQYYPFGEPNNTDDSPYLITESFEAYLDSGDIDFYTLNVASNSTQVYN